MKQHDYKEQWDEGYAPVRRDEARSDPSKPLLAARYHQRRDALVLPRASN